MVSSLPGDDKAMERRPSAPVRRLGFWREASVRRVGSCRLSNAPPVRGVCVARSGRRRSGLLAVQCDADQVCFGTLLSALSMPLEDRWRPQHSSTLMNRERNQRVTHPCAGGRWRSRHLSTSSTLHSGSFLMLPPRLAPLGVEASAWRPARRQCQRITHRWHHGQTSDRLRACMSRC
ncbi:hypothetical protein CC85DRAFT_53022 [Cutaneotrichosporon oleaginosum]|uniref:Uncharacterized protein n=1 Tax=Cutaneotrichosporon oleaginosum TaxID=879819 RepID=A0A0J0XQV0_9TREE|nr:uncharacterized protein CC85DRAFT_53022 [Cutaneotrichosporon oleaginosum]KLT43450.1 hypothetical protein CC85DRAFT_53022 [Cutaneotrichosporon oleaginosum]TXT05337.1 hypothetical protein COLE_06657 [Cutaneotrichosporon oleaginosum]